MIEELKTAENKSVFFTNEDITEFTEDEQPCVLEVRSYSVDDGEIVIAELDDDFCLLAHTFESDPRYFVYQLIDSGSQDQLEKAGYCVMSDEDEFKDTIIINDDAKSSVYKHSDVGAIYSLSSDDNSDVDVSICEFTSSSGYLSHIFIERITYDLHDIEVKIYQGFEVTKEDFELIEN